jgi:hypothetical protein
MAFTILIRQNHDVWMLISHNLVEGDDHLPTFHFLASLAITRIFCHRQDLG